MEAIGQLAGGVAHDFNNLLSVIMSYAQLLQRDLAEKPGPLDDLAQLLGAATRAASLTRQLLAFSRRQMISPTVLELNALVSNLEKMLRRIIGEDIDFATDLDPNLCRVCADPGQVEQVLMNLCVNARDAMPSGGKLTIGTANAELDETFARTHAGTAPGHFVMLSVSDTGLGMDAHTQAHLFEPFFTTKEVGKGTGLGLSTVYGIVRQSGGHIWVYSELGKGTSFKIYLPVVDEPLDRKPKQRPSSPPARATETVLLVEDDDSVRLVASRILRQSGYEVLEASSPELALGLFREHRASIALLLTDVIMPNISGPELAAELLRQQPKLKVLYMSGYSGTAVFRHGALESGKAFLEKPFTPELLTERLREVLDANA
jgi:CheY-like chemotaxis protein